MKSQQQDIRKARTDNDRGWKEILNAHLKDFMEFFWEEAYQDIDWSRPYEALEQELMAIVTEKGKKQKRYIDKLFKVFLKNGREQWLLLHIEVQHTKEEDFSERMFTYFYRIYDKYSQDVASMAVLVDKDKDWRPNQYYRRIWESEISRTYKVIKLIDYKSQVAALHKHSNPFALIVLIQLAALESKANNKGRLLTKLEFFRCLHLHEWAIEKSMNMYRFLDTVLHLNAEFEIQYLTKAKEIDQEYKMSFMSIAERIGFEQGMQQGVQQEAAYLLISMLKVRFKIVPEKYIQDINNAEPDTLNQWVINFVNAQTLKDVFITEKSS